MDGSVGSHFGTLDAGYSKGQVNGEDAVGGLIGHAGDESAEPTVVHSYWDTDRSKTSDSAGGEGKSTVHLQQPTGYTGIYAGWNVDLGGDDEGDNPWQFGTEVQYPALNVDFDGDGQANWREFGAQRGANVWASNLAPARGEPVTLTAQLVGVDCDDSSYAWYRVADDGRAYRAGSENEVEKKPMLYRAQSKTPLR